MPYKNVEDRRRNALRYKAANYEKVRAWERKAEKKYYETHPERSNDKSPRRKEYQRNWQRANADKQQEYGRRYYRKTRAVKIAKRIQWNRDNPEKVAAYRNSDHGRAILNAASRRHAAKKNGFTECRQYPPPPSDRKCAICHRIDKLCLDHDHETGKFRGYICRKCNLGLGMLGDTAESLRRVLTYLAKSDG